LRTTIEILPPRGWGAMDGEKHFSGAKYAGSIRRPSTFMLGPKSRHRRWGARETLPRNSYHPFAVDPIRGGLKKTREHREIDKGLLSGCVVKPPRQPAASRPPIVVNVYLVDILLEEAVPVMRTKFGRKAMLFHPSPGYREPKIGTGVQMARKAAQKVVQGNRGVRLLGRINVSAPQPHSGAAFHRS